MLMIKLFDYNSLIMYNTNVFNLSKVMRNSGA